MYANGEERILVANGTMIMLSMVIRYMDWTFHRHHGSVRDDRNAMMWTLNEKKKILFYCDADAVTNLLLEREFNNEPILTH